MNGMNIPFVELFKVWFLVLLSLRKKSATIRYQKSSNMARLLADKLSVR